MLPPQLFSPPAHLNLALMKNPSTISRMQKSNFVFSSPEMTRLKWMFTIHQRTNGIKSLPCFR